MEISVLCDPRPNLRDKEMTVFVGQLFLSDLFDTDKDMSEHTSVYLEYPERWINILEQRALFKAIELRCPNMEKVSVLTHSVYIIQVTPSGCLKVISNKEDYPDKGYELGVRYCPMVKDAGGLQVFKGLGV